MQLLQSRVNETTTHHSKHMMIDYFRLSNDPSVTSVSLFLIDAPNLICRTLNRQSAGRFDRANCFDRLPLPGYSSPSKIASLTPRSFDYFSPVCNGVLPLTTEPKRRKKTGQRDRTTKRKKRALLQHQSKSFRSLLFPVSVKLSNRLLRQIRLVRSSIWIGTKSVEIIFQNRSL